MEVVYIFSAAVLFFIVIAGLILSTILKRKKESWTGTLTDKKIVEEVRRSDGDSRKVDMNYLYIKLADGSDKKISVGKKLWDSFKVGDKIEKKSGSYDPVKV